MINALMRTSSDPIISLTWPIPTSLRGYATDGRSRRPRATSPASLTEDAFDTLRRTVAESPFEGPTPDGKFLRSDEFYWAVSDCRGGRFHFNAWTGDMAGFDDLPFFDLLLPLDGTNVAVNPPRKLYLGPFQDRPQRFRTAGSATQCFQRQVGENGLRLGPRFF